MATTPPDDKDRHYAKIAWGFLDEHRISPSPENYAIWFQYAVAKNFDLVNEINKILKNKVPFSQETTSYLYNKYIIGSRAQKAIDEAASSAQSVLQEVLKVVNNFSGETKSYNQNVDQYLEDISTQFEDNNVKDMVKQLISKTATLKESGEKINAKLEESTKEIQTLRQNLQEVTQESQRDFLTGVYNRKAFEKLFAEYVETAKEQKKDMCLMMIDIDFFKRFNDKFGHLLGDEVLKIVARSLTDILKGRDVVARFGGEEFVVILPETPIEGALKVAEAIRAAIASKELKRRDTGENYGTITVSMGVARFRPETDTLTSLTKRADDALYRSKREGRNRVTKET